MPRWTLALLPLLAIACSSNKGAAGDPGNTDDASTGDASPDATTDAATDAPIHDASSDVDKAGQCTGAFGNDLTNAFGRLDGTVLAIVKPSDTKCPMYNGTHVVLEVTMRGAVYRMVVNIQSDRTGVDPKVRLLELDHANVGTAWSEGWHPGVQLDYPASLGVHIAAFTPYDAGTLADKIAQEIDLGAKISVYATSSGGSSAHLVHRNGGGVDGAIVIGPERTTPRFLLFHFAEQSF